VHTKTTKVDMSTGAYSEWSADPLGKAPSAGWCRPSVHPLMRGNRNPSWRRVRALRQACDRSRLRSEIGPIAHVPRIAVKRLPDPVEQEGFRRHGECGHRRRKRPPGIDLEITESLCDGRIEGANIEKLNVIRSLA